MLLEQLDLLEPLVQLDPLVLLEQLDLLEPLVRLDLLEQQEQLVPQA